MLEPPAGVRKSARFTIATSPRTGPETSRQNTSRAVAEPRRSCTCAEATVAYVATDTLFAHLFLMDVQHDNCTSSWTSLLSGFGKFKESNDRMYSEA
ncbi:hypothetical protein ALC60_05510 [Trachymyrmex zeteki]|uniref:Uncharacterized protein n=1 Tax=Mycetomoellerius zeteki TaxID=64791 RepID=A0A151X5Q5_9HYME|nr:hypothetical protein ALC60_05510 [Trachymyrmex zeteki]